MACAQKEFLVPVVSRQFPLKTKTNAIAIANDSRFAWAGAVWTKDVAEPIGVAKSE